MKTTTKIWMCLAGVALVALGVFVIKNPGTTLLSLAWVFGLLLGISGAMQLDVWRNIRGFMPRSGMVFFSALLQLILGIILFCNPAPLSSWLPSSLSRQHIPAFRSGNGTQDTGLYIPCMGICFRCSC